MKGITAFLLLLITTAAAFGQNERAQITEKEFEYRNWNYRNLNGDGKTDLRQFAKGKKLVMVVYWAPWCNNWKHDVALVQQLHEKYKDKGLAVIGVSNYDITDRMRKHVEQYKLTFPNVYDSESTAERLKTEHYTERTAAGDTRKWGTPWYVFLQPEKIAKDGDVLATRNTVVNGELIPEDVEKYIRERLGLLGEPSDAAAAAR